MYFVSLLAPLCVQPDEIRYAAENLGEHLSGDTIENSPYEVCARAWCTRMLCNGWDTAGWVDGGLPRPVGVISCGMCVRARCDSCLH